MKFKLVMMRPMGDTLWENSTEYMKVSATSFAVIRESITCFATRIAPEIPFGVNGLWEESESVFFVKWMIDLLRHLGTFKMEEKVARFASVD